MKAHIRPNRPTALVWNFDETLPEYPAFAAAAQAAGLTLHRVTPEDLSTGVGQLCDLPGCTRQAFNGSFSDAFPPALILSGLADGALDKLLADLRSGGVVIPLKAVVTKTNQQWPLGALLAELSEEHEAFHPVK